MKFFSQFLKIQESLDFYRRLLPLNREEERKKFLGSSVYNPVFRYSYDGADIMEVYRMAKNLKSEGPSPVSEFYRRLRKETLHKCSLLAARPDPGRFTDISGKIFGLPSEEDVSFADGVLSGSGSDFSEPVTAREIKKAIKEELLKRSIKGWRIEMKKDMASKMNIKPAENTICINSSSKFLHGEDKRLAVHEIEVHIFRALNGARQKWPIFKTGTAGYNEAEEGLAVYFETSGGQSPPEQMKVYAGRLMAVRSGIEKSFREVFNLLLQWFPPDLAYRLTERAKRGLEDTSCPGALTKDIHYITGYRKIEEIKKEKDFPRILFAGKIAFGDRGRVRDMMKEGLVLPPAYMVNE